MADAPGEFDGDPGYQPHDEAPPEGAGADQPRQFVIESTKPKSRGRSGRSTARKEAPSAELSEDGIAREFARRHQETLRFCHSSGLWHQWTGYAWRPEKTQLAFCWAREECRRIAADLDSDKIKAILGKAGTASAVERFARADRSFAATSEIWDNDPFLLGTPGGTLDLRTGQLSDANRDDFITKLAAVTPDETPKCPLWLDFLDQATGSDAELIRFLRAWCGYTLTGLTREHALLFIFGPGGNGKSVFLNTVSRILGDYCRVSAMETFTASQGDRHPTDLAMLRGARMVCASETEEGRAWAETRIKQLTGGDVITARFMRQDFFEFRPQFKLTIVGNHKPVLRNVDEAARRRFNIVPFCRKPERPDRALEAKLAAESPAVLRWMIDGCIDWQMNGLIRPKVVAEATADYFTEQDSVRQWIDERCETGGRNVSDTMAALFKSWSDYAIASGEKPGTTKWLAQTLLRHGCEQVKNTPGQHGKRGFLGVRVKNEDTSSQWQNRDGY